MSPNTAKERSSNPPVRVNPVGSGVALLGALAMLLSAFLPLAEDIRLLGGIVENTLIQNGIGWVFIVLAVLLGGAVYRAHQRNARLWAPIVLGAIGVVLAVFAGANEDFRTLYPVRPSGEADYSARGQEAAPGIGVYVAGAGGVLAVMGGGMMRRSEPLSVGTGTTGGDRPPGSSPEPRPTKHCPECAETVLAAAKVCKHCGHRLEAGPKPGPTSS